MRQHMQYLLGDVSRTGTDIDASAVHLRQLGAELLQDVVRISMLHAARVDIFLDVVHDMHR